MKHLFFTVTNDLTYDQRMHRICGSLASHGYHVTLVGRKKKHSISLQEHPFKQYRLTCLFQKGIFFYIEYNIRLFIYLLSKRIDGVCAIDLDTILPCLLASQLKGFVRIYDAHEYFTEMKEVRRRKNVQKIWQTIEAFSIPKFCYCYTVSAGLAEIFNKKYNKNFIIIRNITMLQKIDLKPPKSKFILYQGSVNEGRGLEHLIPAMEKVDIPLVICGDGNFMSKVKNMISIYKLNGKITLSGMIPPDDLKLITPMAMLGINLTETEDMHHFNALPNKFFDYIHAAVPQITMNLPEYKMINESFEVAVLINDLNENTIAVAINETLASNAKMQKMRQNCRDAAEVYNWQNEEKKLIRFYNSIFSLFPFLSLVNCASL